MNPLTSSPRRRKSPPSDFGTEREHLEFGPVRWHAGFRLVRFTPPRPRCDLHGDAAGGWLRWRATPRAHRLDFLSVSRVVSTLVHRLLRSSRDDSQPTRKAIPSN
jgi:hypothetical protein